MTRLGIKHLWKLLVVPLCFLAVAVGNAQFIQQGNKLIGTGAVGIANQGASVSLSSNGNTAIFGGSYDNTGVGAAWVYTRTGGVWSQQGSKLIGSDTVGTGGLGSSVALSADGNTAIVGGPHDNASAGAAWVFTQSNGVWSQQGSKLVGTDAVGSGGLGKSVALSADGNTAIVGGQDDNNGMGAAWVFTRSGGVWSQQGSKLVGNDALRYYYSQPVNQGCSVSISADGNTAIVGGYNDSGLHYYYQAVGAAWVFTRTGGVWSQQGSKLAAAEQPYQRLGFSVSLSANGNTALVGGPGHEGAWVFTRTGGVWSQGGTLSGIDEAGSALLGYSVSLSADGNTAIVGGPADNISVGAAWLFTRSGGIWTQMGNKLVGTGAVGNANQGISVSLSGDGNTVMAGGWSDNSSMGAAWVFAQGQPWRETLVASDGCSGTGSLSYGLAPWATDGLDSSLGEYELPPLPPSGVFDLRFVLPVVPAIASPVDIRSDTSQSTTWRLTFQPGPCGYPLTFSWDSTAFPATGSFTLTDEVGGTVVKLNMRGEQKYVLSDSNITSLRVVYKNAISRDVTLGAGWNLVSVPVRAADSSVSTLYPGASSHAFGFQNAYVIVTSFTPGKGYWLKFNTGQTSTVNGSQVNPPDVAVATGWNLMGPFETDVATSAITSTPPGIVTSNYYGFNGGYQQATTVGMGKGYWVKVSQAGVLHLPWGLGRVGVRPVVAQVSESGVSLKLSDAAGLSGALSLMKAGDLKGSSDLPPLPPSGIFDVRFGSNTSREALTGTGGVHDIRLSGAALPVQLQVTRLSGHQMQVVDGVSGGKLLREVITEGRVITLGHGVLTESGSGSILIQEMNDLPVAFALSQNYPNPFNPTSVISFALPEASQVNLDLYSILGQKVLSLANGEYPAGNHTVELNAQNLASGTYFYRIQAGKYNAIKKLMVLK